MVRDEDRNKVMPIVRTGMARDIKGESRLMAQVDVDELVQLRTLREKLSVFMRHHYRREIGEGEHIGKDLGDLVCHYLTIERSRWLVRIRTLWWELMRTEGD